jgi:hypothetical protein
VIVTGDGPIRIEMNTYQLYGGKHKVWPNLSNFV